MENKIKKIVESGSYFAMGSIDHSPQEVIKKNNPNEIYSSAIVFFSDKFYSEFDNLQLTLCKWGNRRGSSKKGFINKIWPKLQNLPFFSYQRTATGKEIYDNKRLYINALRLSKNITTMQRNGKVYDVYTVYSGFQPAYPFCFKLEEERSLAALHIAYFIIESFYAFKIFCKKNNINIVDDIYCLNHDFFPHQDWGMGTIVGTLVNMSYYYGYPTRVMSLIHLLDNVDYADELLVDNLAGFFRHVANGNFSQEEIQQIFSINECILSATSSIV